MRLRNKDFFLNQNKIIKTNIYSYRRQMLFYKTLVVPIEMTNRDVEKIIEKSLGDIDFDIISEEKVISLTNIEKNVNDNFKSLIDSTWEDGIEFSVEVYFSRITPTYFTVVGDWKTTEKEIYNFISVFCLDSYKIHVDEIGDCWIKRECIVK